MTKIEDQALEISIDKTSKLLKAVRLNGKLNKEHLRIAQIKLRSIQIDPSLWAKGTDFQKKVWSVCAKIPEGAVVTYSEIARVLGDPKKRRAVAQALGKNHWPLKVPCHRVVGEKNLGGFTSKRGPRQKAELLNIETKK